MADPEPEDLVTAVAGRQLTMSLGLFKRACSVYIDEESQKPNCDSHLVGLLCGAIRLAREFEDSLKRPIV